MKTAYACDQGYHSYGVVYPSVGYCNTCGHGLCGMHYDLHDVTHSKYKWKEANTP